MKYVQTRKVFRLEYEEIISKVDDDNTEVIIELKLKNHNRSGFSLDLLNELIQTSTANLSQYRIYHSPEGLTICGKF